MINRMYVIILLSVLPLTACGSAQGGEKTEAPEVYFIREITPRNMVRIYKHQRNINRMLLLMFPSSFPFASILSHIQL